MSQVACPTLLLAADKGHARVCRRLAVAPVAVTAVEHAAMSQAAAARFAPAHSISLIETSHPILSMHLLQLLEWPDT